MHEYITLHKILENEIKKVNIDLMYRNYLSRDISPYDFDSQKKFWVRIFKLWSGTGVGYFKLSKVKEALILDDYLPPVDSAIDELYQSHYIISKEDATKSYLTKLTYKLYNIITNVSLTEEFLFYNNFCQIEQKILHQFFDQKPLFPMDLIIYKKSIKKFCGNVPLDIIICSMKSKNYVILKRDGLCFCSKTIPKPTEEQIKILIILKKAVYYLTKISNKELSPDILSKTLKISSYIKDLISNVCLNDINSTNIQICDQISKTFHHQTLNEIQLLQVLQTWEDNLSLSDLPTQKFEEDTFNLKNNETKTSNLDYGFDDSLKSNATYEKPFTFTQTAFEPRKENEIKANFQESNIFKSNIQLSSIFNNCNLSNVFL